MNARIGWTLRVFGVLVAAGTAWFVVVHADGFLPALTTLAGLGPAALPIGLALVGVGVLNRGFQARAAYRLLDVPAPFGRMVKLSATSYATNKVIKSAGAAGLVPYLTHADRSGQSRARVVAAYMSTKVAETMSLCALVGAAVVAGAATGGLHGTVLFGAIASAGYAIVVGTAMIVIAGKRSFIEAIAAAARRVAFRVRTRFGRAHPATGRVRGTRVGVRDGATARATRVPPYRCSAPRSPARSSAARASSWCCRASASISRSPRRCSCTPSR